MTIQELCAGISDGSITATNIHCFIKGKKKDFLFFSALCAIIAGGGGTGEPSAPAIQLLPVCLSNGCSGYATVQPSADGTAVNILAVFDETMAASSETVVPCCTDCS